MQRTRDLSVSGPEARVRLVKIVTLEPVQGIGDTWNHISRDSISIIIYGTSQQHS